MSHEVATRGWKEVKENEVCKIPGVGPVAPETAKEIAKDAFLNGVFYDGKDLRHFKRWSRHIPIEVEVALELGEPPDYDGPVCVDCGNRFRTEFDHLQPVGAGGPTSEPNLCPKCRPCHLDKTKRDMEAIRKARAARRRRPDTRSEAPKQARGP
ncbi:MAG: HNH endonuclease [Actinomycetota bacterium]|nr:HNH endonuclease [Actinomycetota bacterium]